MKQVLFNELLEHCNGNTKETIKLLKELLEKAEQLEEQKSHKYYVELEFNDIYAQSKWFETEEEAVNWYKDSFENGASIDHNIRVHLMTAAFDEDDNIISDIVYVKTL